MSLSETQHYISMLCSKFHFYFFSSPPEAFAVRTSCDNVQLYMSHQVKWETVRILCECVQIAGF